MTLPLTFPGNKANFFVDHAFGAHAGTVAEFSILGLQGSATALVYVLAFTWQSTAVDGKFGTVSVDPLDGAVKTALSATGTGFRSDKQAARSAAPFVGTSLTDRAPAAFKLVAASSGDVSPFPIPLLLRGSADWFFMQGDAANEDLKASIMWVELPAAG